MWAFAINWCLLSHLLTFHILVFSSETALLNELKFGKKHQWKVFYIDLLTNMAAIGISCFQLLNF